MSTVINSPKDNAVLLNYIVTTWLY